MQARDQILARFNVHFRQQHFHEKWRAENLFEIGFQLRAEPEANQPPQAHVLGRAIESFEMRGIDGCLPDLFDVGRMPQSGKGVAVEQFKNFGVACANAEQKNSLRQAGPKHRRTAFELLAHVLAAISDRLEPAIRFLDHGLSSSACRSASIVSMPEPRKTLTVANVWASGFTPPVAESNSEAVISRRNANCTACFRFISPGRGRP